MAESSINASALSTIRVNDEALVSGATTLAEIARSFSQLERDQITDSMVHGAGYEVAVSAVATARREIDEHEGRVTAGLSDDELMLLRTVECYRTSDGASARAASALAGRLENGSPS